MSSSSHPLRGLAAAMVGTVLLPTTFLGVVGVVSDEGPMRPIWGMMAVGGVIGVGGCVSTLREVVIAGRVERERVRDARAGDAAGEVLARWRLDRTEGRAFAVREWARRREEVAYGALGCFLLGGAFLWLTKGDPWGAFAAATFVAVLYLGIGLAKYGMEYQAAVGPEGDDVIVLPDAVYVAGTWHALAGDRELLGVRLAADALEFTVRWQTRDGTASDTIRAPVPAPRRGDAERIEAFFRR